MPFHTLQNAKGSSARLTEYGASLVALHVPDRDGRFDNVVLGFDTLDEYRAQHFYCGATIGRYAGRIRNARFALDGREYLLAANSGIHQLHGGPRGFDRATWQVADKSNNRIRFRYLSLDGEEGFPGNLEVDVVYSLDDDDALRIEFNARTDAPTVLNLTNHAYFNLAGSGDFLGHEIQINASRYAPIDAELVVTGELCDVTNTRFDFRRPRHIGAASYDHDFLLDTSDAARIVEPVSGRVLDVSTTEPSLHLYSGLAQQRAFALEAQHLPDSPNQPHFPSTEVRPGDSYEQVTTYRFSTCS